MDYPVSVKVTEVRVSKSHSEQGGWECFVGGIGPSGQLLTASGQGKTIEDAIEAAYANAEAIVEARNG